MKSVKKKRAGPAAAYRLSDGVNVMGGNALGVNLVV